MNESFLILPDESIVSVRDLARVQIKENAYAAFDASKPFAVSLTFFSDIKSPQIFRFDSKEDAEALRRRIKAHIQAHAPCDDLTEFKSEAAST
ncbi:MAG: hypothetical protein IPL39_16120 [Opitutaceae bacterium]|nr:hypothetical protein [Opitutaceae bacterium]